MSSKTWVLGVTVGGEHAAYPFEALEEAGVVSDELDGKPIRIFFDDGNAWAEQDGVTLPTIRLYWFAWVAFHPDTRLYGDDG